MVETKTFNISTVLKALFDMCFDVSTIEDQDTLWFKYLRVREFLTENRLYDKSYISDALIDIDRCKKVNEYFKSLVLTVPSLKHVYIEKNIDNDGLCIKSAESFTSESYLFEIPTQMVIYSEKLSNMFKSDAFLSKMENVFFAFSLILEFYNNINSPYWSYLVTLPNKYETIAYFTEEDFKILRGSPSFKSALILWFGIIRQYAYLHELVIKVSKSTEETCVDASIESRRLLENFSLNDYFWGVSVVMSRNFPLPSLIDSSVSVLSLIPVVDLCNHRSTPTVTIFYEPSRNSCIGVANEPVEKDQEIYINYGRRSSSDYVISNGFFPENNNINFVSIDIPFSKNDKMRITKMNILNLPDMKRLSSALIIKDTFEWSGDLLAYFRLYSANKEIIDKIQSVQPNKIFELLSDPLVKSSSQKENIAEFIFISKLRSLIGDIQSSNNQHTINGCKTLTDIQKNIKLLKNYEMTILTNALNIMYRRFPNFSK